MTSVGDAWILGEVSVAGAKKRSGRVLVVWYSQSGQLHRAAKAFVAPLAEAGLDITWQKLEPRSEFPFPWRLWSFLRVFPDTVTGRGCELAQPTVGGDERFDLIVFAYTVWYLSPSLPAQGFFASPLRDTMRDTPVVTLIACRNMWISAEARTRRLIREAGGRHVGTVAATDDGPPWATFVTTPRWLLTGRRDRFLRIFPPAGISDDTIASLSRFGEALVDRWDRLRNGGPNDAFDGMSPMSFDRPMVLPDLLIGRLFRPAGRVLASLRSQGRIASAAGFTAFGVWLVTSVVTVTSLLAAAQLLLRSQAHRLTDRYLSRLGAEPRA
jgi:hypothetical protein